MERQAAAVSVASTFAPSPGPRPIESPKLAVESATPRVEEGESMIDGTEISNTSDSTQSESINVWPDDAAESAFLAETRGVEADVKQPAAESKPKEETALAPLPKLDELVNRIPVETRELLDELFRAKFTTVRRVKESDLKT
jgi:hypothetical protein